MVFVVDYAVDSRLFAFFSGLEFIAYICGHIAPNPDSFNTAIQMPNRITSQGQ